MFFHVWGGPPWGQLKPPPLSWKKHFAAEIVRAVANISRVVANILRVVADKAHEEAKSCWPMKIFSIVFENFSKFFWIFNCENSLYLSSMCEGDVVP